VGHTPELEEQLVILSACVTSAGDAETGALASALGGPKSAATRLDDDMAG
jgi:hypothetical protein